MNEQTKKTMILRGKEKELKLNQIKLREVEKYIKNLKNKDGRLLTFEAGFVGLTCTFLTPQFHSDTRSVVSESHVDQMERENSKV